MAYQRDLWFHDWIIHVTPTIKDVAKQAGVSRSTVSRVLTGSPHVSPEARDAVMSAIRSTGYRLNSHARSLASGRNHAVAVLLTQPSDELFEDPTMRELIKGVSEGFGDSSDALILLLAGSDLERRRTAPFLDKRRIDGVVHLTPHMTDPLLDQIISAELPVAVCGRLRMDTPSPLVRTVTVDDTSGARLAGEHLLQSGARRIAMIAGPEDAPGSEARLEGFQMALSSTFDPALLRHGDYSHTSGRAAMQALLAADPSIDGVFCASDRMAMGAYQVLEKEGRRIPDDVQVVGFDDHEFASELDPPLTSVRQPIQLLGEQAMVMLMALIRGEDPGHRVFPTSLIVRSSTKGRASDDA